MSAKHPFPMHSLLLFLVSCLSLACKPHSPPTHSPLMLSHDHGQTWVDDSKGLPDDTQVSFLEPMGSCLVLASDNRGLFLRCEGSEAWEQIGSNLPGTKLNSLFVYQNTLYVGVYGMGIFQSKDKGNSWISANYNLPELRIQAIHRREQILYAGTDRGIFMRKVQDSVWQSTDIQTQVLSLYEWEGQLVAGTSLGTALSHDKGESWEWVRTEGAVHYTHHIGPRIIELALNGDVVYSDDGGENWTQTFYYPRQGSYVYEIIQSGPYQLMSNNYGLHRSSDKGQTWSMVYRLEDRAFFDLVTVGEKLYGGMRVWDEYRGRK